MNAKSKKIAIISNSLGIGGAEKFSGILSEMLFDLGFEVHIIIIENHVSYPFKGKLFNLGEICINNNSIFRKFRKGYLLYNYLKQNEIDTIIDNRARNVFVREWIIKSIYGNRKTLYVVHTAVLSMYFSKSKILNKILFKGSHKIICVAKAIEDNVKTTFGLKNVMTIYNPFSIIGNEKVVDDESLGNYFLYFGRLDEKQKNLLFLIESFSKSKVFQKGYKLVLIGDGESKKAIEDKIMFLKMEKYILMLPFTTNVHRYVANAKATVLSSNYEGFPLSIVESLALGVPVISIDCETGPREIIKDKYNGLLVEPNNIDTFSEAFNAFVQDDFLYQTCKGNTKKSVAHLCKENLQKEWLKILIA